jgi:hypothetical protein
MLGALALSATAYVQDAPNWGQNPQHSGFIPAFGQSRAQKLADMVYDPFVAQEQGENGGELLAHYQAPLTNRQDVFMEFISGTIRHICQLQSARIAHAVPLRQR